MFDIYPPNLVDSVCKRVDEKKLNCHSLHYITYKMSEMTEQIDGESGFRLTTYFELLENVFGRLSLETISGDGLFKEHLNVSNAHFYTPFTNLSL